MVWVNTVIVGRAQVHHRSHTASMLMVGHGFGGDRLSEQTYGRGGADITGAHYHHSYSGYGFVGGSSSRGTLVAGGITESHISVPSSQPQ